MKINDSISTEELDLRLRRATLVSGSEKRSARDALLLCTKTKFYLYARALLHSRNRQGIIDSIEILGYGEKFTDY